MYRIHSSKAFVASMLVLLLAAGGVMAIAPGSLFELDGNTTTGDQSPPLDDWNLLNGTGVAEGCVTDNAGAPGDSVARTFCSGAGRSIFTQGGSKDPNLISAWHWKPADTVPDKTTLTNGYAARYTDPGTGNTIFVFGAERFAVNGDANIGIWLFQDNITNQEGGTFGPGVHKNGDLFAVSAFTQGGTNPGISVYKWNTACLKGVKTPVAEIGPTPPGTPGGTPNSCAESNLSLAFVSDEGTSCGGGDAACAATNSTGPIEVPWDYASKFGADPHVVPTAGFFEGGMDISELLSGANLCFSSFLIETRSSQEPSAVLKDFIVGDLSGCSMPLVKLIDGVEPTGCSRIDPTNPLLGANLEGICLDKDGNPVAAGLFTATLYGGPFGVYPTGPGAVVGLPPRFEAPPIFGVDLVGCETVPTGWKLLETGDVEIILTPLDAGFNSTPNVDPAIPPLDPATTRCFHFNIPLTTVTAEIRINNVKPKLDIAKSAALTLNYAYLVTNSGNVTITGPFTVSDNTVTVTCPVPPDDGDLDPGEFITCTAGPFLLGPSGSVTNTATASGTEPAITSDPDDVKVDWAITDPTP